MPYDDDVDDAPIAQRLRFMTVLDVSPGRAQTPDTGPPIGILTLEFRNEIEQPIMFKMEDVRRLAVGFLNVLAHHGDETAEKIIWDYAKKLDFEKAMDPPPLSQIAVTESQKSASDGPILIAKFAKLKAEPISFHVVAGYKFLQPNHASC